MSRETVATRETSTALAKLGAAGDGNTDDWAIIQGAINNAKGGALIDCEAKTYYCSQSIYLCNPVVLAGVNGYWAGKTKLLFPPGIPGVIVDWNPNLATSLQTGGYYSRIRGLQIEAKPEVVGTTNQQAHGLVIKQQCVVEGDVSVWNFTGDGVNLDSNIGLSQNAVFSELRNMILGANGSGLYVDGGNAGGCLFSNIVPYESKRWSFIDNTAGVQNTYIGGGSEYPAQATHLQSDLRSGGGVSHGWKERANILRNVAVADTTVSIEDFYAGFIPSSGLIYLNNEQIAYTGITRNVGTAAIPKSGGGTVNVAYANLTGCTRGANATTAAAHLAVPFGGAILTYFYWPEGADFPKTGPTSPSHVGLYIEGDYSVYSRAAGGCFFGISGANPFSATAPCQSGRFVKMGTLAVTATAAATTITLQSTIGIPAAGSGRINNEEIAWTSRTPGAPGATGTLNGVTRGLKGTTAVEHIAGTGTPGVYEAALMLNIGLAPLAEAPDRLGTIPPSLFVQGGVDATAPWNHFVNVLMPPATQTGWSARVNNSNSQGYTYLQSSSAVNAEIGWDMALAAGTWEVSFMHLSDFNAGIFTVSLDGKTVGTTDSYAAATVFNTIATFAGITVITPGVKRLLFKMATKNASSSAFAGTLQMVSMRRTA